MARINFRNDTGVPTVRSSPGPTDVSGAVRALQGQGVQALGEAVTAIANQFAVKKAKTFAAKASTNFKNEAIEAFEKSKRLRDEGSVEGFTPEFIKVLDEIGAKYIEDAPNNLSRELIQEQFDIIKSSFFEKALNFENQAITAQSIADLNDTINASSNGLLIAPDEFEDSLATALAAIEAVSDLMTPEQTRVMVEQAQNSLAISAVRGYIADNPAVAKAQLEQGVWDKYLTPDQKNSLLKLSTEEKKTSDAVAAFEASRRVQAEIAQIQQHGIGTGLTRDRVKNSYIAAGATEEAAEVEARKFEIEKAAAEKVHYFSSTIQFASPADRNAVLEELKPKEGSRTFDIDQKIYEQAAQYAAQVDAAVRRDPMAYAMTNAGVREAFDPNLGGSIEKGLTKALTLQAKMLNSNYEAMAEKGMSTNDIIRQTEGIRVLSDEQVAHLVNRLNTSDPNEILGVLGDIREDYGSVFGDTFVYNKVLNELVNGGLNGGMAFALNAIEFGIPATTELIQAVNTPMETLNKTLTQANIPFADVKLRVQSELQDFRNAFIAGDPGQIDFYNEVETALIKMAANRVASGLDEDEDDAAEYVMRSVVEAMFHITESALIPRLDANDNPIDTQAVANGMRTIINRSDTEQIKQAILQKGTFPGQGIDVDLRLRSLGSTGSFVNAPTGGYHLQITDLGVPMFLIDSNGNPAVFTDDEIIKIATTDNERRRREAEERQQQRLELARMRARAGGVTE